MTTFPLRKSLERVQPQVGQLVALKCRQSTEDYSFCPDAQLVEVGDG
jgi:hypothetical protein